MTRSSDRGSAIRGRPLRDSPVKQYTLAVAVAFVAFFAFAALQYLRQPQISTVPSLVTAALIPAACAGAFAFSWRDRPAWLLGLILSGGFWIFLIFAFFMLRAAGEPYWWPIIDALLITAASCLGAYVGRALRRGKPIPSH